MATDIFVYDTRKDSDKGAWRTQERARRSSWYNETLLATHPSGYTSKSTSKGSIWVNDSGWTEASDGFGSSKVSRGYRQEFPEIAAIIATSTDVWIIDAREKAVWMHFDQGSGFALGASTNNAPSSCWAADGIVCIGMNGSSATGLYVVDFKNDTIYRFNSTDRRTFTGEIEDRNTSSSYPAGQAITALAIADSIVNAVFVTPVHGKIFIALGTDTAASVIDWEDSTTYDYSDATGDDYIAVWISQNGDLWALNETKAQLEMWEGVIRDLADETNGTPDGVWDETTTPALWHTAVTVQTAPKSLALKENGSFVDGLSPLLLIGHSHGLTALHTKENDETNGATVYYDRSAA